MAAVKVESVPQWSDVINWLLVARRGRWIQVSLDGRDAQRSLVLFPWESPSLELLMFHVFKSP